MIVFDLEEKPGVWFDLYGDGRVQLRAISADDWKEIRKQTVKKKVEYKRVEGKAERFPVEEVNEDLQNELFWDKTIQSWDGFSIKIKKDGKTEIVNCIPENCTSDLKFLLMMRSPKFAKFVGECLKQLTEDETKQAEQAEKNLLPSQSGDLG